VQSTLTQAPALDVQQLDVQQLDDLAAQYLNPLAQEAMTRKAETLSVVLDDGRAFLATYFTVITRLDNPGPAAERICKAINELANEHLIHSTLAPLSSIELARQFGQVQRCAVFCFVLVPAQKRDEIKARFHDLATEEGGFASTIGDTKLPLKEGEFLAEIQVAHQLMTKVDPKAMLQRQIDDYLKFLPKGTEVVDVTELAIYSLSYPFQVKFYNALLQDVSKVELDYVREVVRLDGEIHQFNLVTGIKYYDRNGKLKYSDVA
jgi:hypothetical protein